MSTKRRITPAWIGDDGSDTIVGDVIMHHHDLMNDFAVTSDKPGETIITRVTGTETLAETGSFIGKLSQNVAFRFNEVKNVTSSLKRTLPQSTKGGFEVQLVNTYTVERGDYDSSANVYEGLSDDPWQCQIKFRQVDGTQIIDGSTLLQMLMETLSFIVDLEYDEDDEKWYIAANQATLERLINGATKPKELI